MLAKISSLEKKKGILVQILSPDAVYSPLCVRAALELQDNAQAASAAHATAPAAKNSLLTALALTPNFSSALKLAGAKNPRDFVLVAWGSNACWAKFASLGFKKLPWGKKDASHFAKFYGISKAPLKVFPLELLIIEKMAIART